MFKTGGKTFNKEKDKNSYEFARSTKSTTATVDRTVLLTETADKMTDLGDIRRLIGTRKRHVINNLEAEKQMNEHPMNGDLEKLFGRNP